MTQPPDVETLIPSMATSGDGNPLAAEVWISSMGSYPLALGYSTLFWPRVVAFEGYVLRADFSIESLRGFEQAENASRRSVEAVMNHIHLGDIHNDEASNAQLLHLGRVLRETYTAKLKLDFPGRQFIVHLNDDVVEFPEYEITFYQV